MPKVLLTEEMRNAEKRRKRDDEIRAKIGAYMAVNRKTLPEVGVLAGIKRSTMYSRFEHPGELSLDEYDALMDVVG